MGLPTLELGIDTAESRRLRELARETGAFLTGDFTLTSGRKSQYYIDGKRITLTPEGAYLIGKVVLTELAGDEVDAVGGVATGAYPIVAAFAVVSYVEGKPRPVFIVREVAKEHGTMKKIEGHLKEGDRVAVLEDVLTTGGSVMKAIETVEAKGCRVARVIVLCDRDEGGGEMLKNAGYSLTAILRIAHH